MISPCFSKLYKKGGIYAFMERPEANGRKRPLRHNGDSVGNERRTFAGLVRVASDGRSTRRRFAGSDRQQPGDQKKHRNRRHFLFCGYLYTRPDMRSGTQGSKTSLSVYDGSAIQRIRSDFRRDGRICYGFFTPERIALPGTSPYSRVRATDGFVRSDRPAAPGNPGGGTDDPERGLRAGRNALLLRLL